ncbi:MAG TPA: phosphatase PAP2 family protein [Flavipsychrobacter sp.]|nr:phosphatase PAP2 family protein [Flavipsychrobacter sp.]
MWLQKLHEIVVFADYTAWYYLNTVWHNAFLDAVIPFFRNQWTWAPLYLFLLVFMLMNYRLKGLIWCLFFLATFGISDQLSAHVFKEIFIRVRPCNNPMLVGLVHNIVPCGGGFSFPSSHAANHFALAIFGAITLGHLGKWIWYVAILWAVLVSYAQVYVGVHFPLDVTCGGLLGIAAGLFTAKIFRVKFDLRQEPLPSVEL